MFQVGEYIMYFPVGVCKVNDIAYPEVKGLDALSYSLTPLYQKSTKYYIPTTSEKIDRVMTAEEAKHLIEQMPEVKPFETKEKSKEQVEFKNAYKSKDRMEIIRLVKTLYLRKQERESQRKTLPQSEVYLLKEAEQLIHGEIAFSLDIPLDKALSVILNTLSIDEELRSLH